MKKLILLFVITFTIQLSAQLEKKYFKDGVTLKETGNLKNGFKDGKWEEFYENGKLKTTGNYTNDERNGEWKIYFDNGQLAAVGNYTSTKFPTPGTWKFYSKEGVEQEFNCPEPTRDNFTNVCNSIYERKESESKFGDKYLEDLWMISCVTSSIDNDEVAKIKIQTMWNKYRKKFRCYGYTGVSVSDANIAKFSIDTGFSSFLIFVTKKYQLDMNFVDPADDKTLLDFLKMQSESYKNSSYSTKYDEYNRIYNLLRSNGAKHSWELNQ